MDVKKWMARLAIAFAATGCDAGEDKRADAMMDQLEAQIGDEKTVFFESLNNNDDMRSLTKRFVYADMFENSAGIRGETVERLLRDESDAPAVEKLKEDVARQTKGVMENLRADALTADFLPRIYDYELDARMRALPGGSAALDDVGDKHAAAALATVLYTFGDEKGTGILTKAVNSTGEKRAKEKAAAAKKEGREAEPFVPLEARAHTGPELFAAYGALARDPAARPGLVRAVEKEAEAVARAARLKANFADQIPEYRRASLTYRDDGLAWASFLKALDHPDRKRSDLHKFVYKNVFVGEGGHQLARTSSAVGGIMNDTVTKLMEDESRNPFVRELKREVASHLDGRKQMTTVLPSDILPDFYDYDLMHRFRALKHADGKQMSPEEVLGAIGEKHAAAALVDTLFRFGDAGGGTIIAKAVDRLNEGAAGYKPVGEADLFGPRLFGEYKKIAKDPKKLQPLLDAIAVARGENVLAQSKREKFKKHADSLKAGEARRSEAFRFLDRGKEHAASGERKPGTPTPPG